MCTYGTYFSRKRTKSNCFIFVKTVLQNVDPNPELLEWSDLDPMKSFRSRRQIKPFSLLTLQVCSFKSEYGQLVLDYCTVILALKNFKRALKSFKKLVGALLCSCKIRLVLGSGLKQFFVSDPESVMIHNIESKS